MQIKERIVNESHFSLRCWNIRVHSSWRNRSRTWTWSAKMYSQKRGFSIQTKGDCKKNLHESSDRPFLQDSCSKSRRKFFFKEGLEGPSSETSNGMQARSVDISVSFKRKIFLKIAHTFSTLFFCVNSLLSKSHNRTYFFYISLAKIDMYSSA